jgi:hypothetical protein
MWTPARSPWEPAQQRRAAEEDERVVAGWWVGANVLAGQQGNWQASGWVAESRVIWPRSSLHFCGCCLGLHELFGDHMSLLTHIGLAVDPSGSIWFQCTALEELSPPMCGWLSIFQLEEIFEWFPTEFQLGVSGSQIDRQRFTQFCCMCWWLHSQL